MNVEDKSQEKEIERLRQKVSDLIRELYVLGCENKGLSLENEKLNQRIINLSSHNTTIDCCIKHLMKLKKFEINEEKRFTQTS